MRHGPWTILAIATLLSLAPAASARAQGIAITPLAGAYIPASDFYSLRDQANQQLRVDKQAAFALGANVDLGMLRASVAYATGATLSDHGVQNGGNIGNGSLLAAAGDVVLRPRVAILQPFVLAGVGVKRSHYSFNSSVSGSLFPKNETDLAGHLGAGLNVLFGNIGITGELTDFITYKSGNFGPHDAFAMVGLRLVF